MEHSPRVLPRVWGTRCQLSRETPYLMEKPRQVKVCPAKRESISESCVQTAASLPCPFPPMWHTLTGGLYPVAVTTRSWTSKVLTCLLLQHWNL